MATLADSLHERLAEYGLIEARNKVKAAAQTVAQFVADFIAGRVDVAPGTVTNYRQTETKLVEFFGTRDRKSVV